MKSLLCCLWRELWPYYRKCVARNLPSLVKDFSSGIYNVSAADDEDQRNCWSFNNDMYNSRFTFIKVFSSGFFYVGTDDDEVVRACWSLMRCLEFALVKDFGSGIHNIGTALVCADNDWSILIID